MNATELLKEIFKSKVVIDAKGNEYPLNSSIDEEEGAFIQQLISKYSAKKTIEIGCAYGISSLFICSAIEKSNNATHTIIDAYQSGYFKNIGVTNLNKANIGCYNLIEGLSEIELPKLLAEGKKYDFCFIDGNHTFDHTLIDFFYLNRMLDVGGIIVFDDIGLPSVSKVLRYVLNYPAYQYVGHVPKEYSKKRALFESIFKAPLGVMATLFSKKMKHEIFSSKVISNDKKLHLNTSMIALQKIKADDREWYWYEDF